MDPTADSRNEVAQAVDIARGLVDAHSGHSARWPDEITEAVDAITSALVQAGVGQRHAEWATTRWVITRRDIWACVAEVDEGGPVCS